MRDLIRSLIVGIVCLFSLQLNAINWRQISTEDGLPNSAILSLCEDSDGMLWIGTLDGLCGYDGENIFPMSMFPEFSMLTGNIIENIVNSEPGVMWVQTNYGLDRIVYEEGIHFSFPEYQGQEKLRVSPEGEVFILSENNSLAFYRKKPSEFVKIGEVNENFTDILDMAVYSSSIRLYTKNGIIDYILTKDSEGYFNLGKEEKVSDIKLKYAFNCHPDITLAIDDNGNLLEFRSKDIKPFVLYNIGSEINKRGEISDMLVDDMGNIFISFSIDGLLKLDKQINNAYSLQDLGLNIGVFCMAKSNTQNLVWAGTDCHGLYTFYDGPYSFQSLTFPELNNIVSRPIRSVLLDDSGNLWLGTKGDGLLLVRGFNPFDVKRHGDTKLFSTANSVLTDNSVYALAKSKLPILWIGTESGLNFYSYKDNSLRRVNMSPSVNIGNIHGILEQKDSTLLITTGSGIFKGRIVEHNGIPTLSDLKQYTLDNGNRSSNFFFSQTNDTIGSPIFSNRGLGAFVLESDSLKKAFTLKNDYNVKSVNDIFTIIRDKDVLWVGTGQGLMKITDDDDKLFSGIKDGFLNNTIHSMLKDDDGNLWIGTNFGLMHFNPTTEKTHAFSLNHGL